MVDTSTHKSINLSRYIYVELVNPTAETVIRVKIRPDENHQFHGYIPIPDKIPGGNYAFLAYTRYMLAEEYQYLFKRDICITMASNWETAQLKTTKLLSAVDNTKVQFELLNSKQKKISLKKVKVTDIGEKSVTAKLDKQKKIDIRIRNEKIVSNSCMRIDMTDNHNNFYSQYFATSTGGEDYEVTFYPEGGYLLLGAPCRISYKVLDISGNCIDATLKLIDEQGTIITKSNTRYAGMGAFIFTPEKGKRYIIQAQNKQGVVKEFELPPSQEHTYGIVLKDQGAKIQVTINSSIHSPQSNLLLLIHIRGKLIHAQWLSSDKKETIMIEKDKCPSGIVQCLLLDNSYNVLSERLGFIPYRKIIECNVKYDKINYGKRELIHTNLSVTDAKGKPIKSNLSISVTDKLVGVTDTAHHILSTLLLSSELKGRIETPSYYFQENPEAVESLDLLLMTQGWKRYSLPCALKREFKKPLLMPEKFTSLSGRLKSKKGFGGRDHIAILVHNFEFALNREVKLGADRTFRVDSLEYPEGACIGIIGKRFIRKGENYGVNIAGAILDQEEYFQINDKTVPQPILSDLTCKIPWDIVYPWDANNYYISPVIVKSEVLNFSLDKKDIAKLKLENVWELVEYLGGKFTYPFPVQEVVKKGGGKRFVGSSEWMCIYNNMPLILIVNDRVLNMSAGIFNYLSLSDIQRIHLYSVDKNHLSFYNPLLDSIFGNSPVAILKLTLHPNVNINRLLYFDGLERQIQAYGKIDIQTDVYPSGGYQVPVEFYSPKYEKRNNGDIFMPDFRSILYWKPDLQTDSLGKCDFSFYSADKVTTYKMVIEGVTEEGEIVYETREIDIK